LAGIITARGARAGGFAGGLVGCAGRDAGKQANTNNAARLNSGFQELQGVLFIGWTPESILNGGVQDKFSWRSRGGFNK
jgi:hypothetical protein